MVSTRMEGSPELATRRRVTFTIPVFAHVKKFILKKYLGTTRVNGTIKTEEYNTFGKLVTKALRDNRLRMKYNNSQERDRLTDSITITLTKDQSKFGPKLHKLTRINQDMDDAFKEHLLTWIAGQQEAGISAHAACKMFLEFYDIDEKEYSLDAAYKVWQRSSE